MAEIVQTSADVLQMQGVYKSFGARYALNNASFNLEAREIHGLLGGNGAGKTTLMNILYGLYREDKGTIKLHGKQVEINSPKDAIARGIGMVHQHFLQVENYTVLENITLGLPGNNRFSADYRDETRVISSLIERFGLQVDLHARIEDLPMGTRQKVEILKALYRGVGILILDEPSTNLTPQEVDGLFKSLREMVNEGMSIVFITHKLQEVLDVCDRITVLRHGCHVLTLRRGEATEEAFIRAMVGEEMKIQESVLFADHARRSPVVASGQPPRLYVDSVDYKDAHGVEVLRNLTLDVHAGEILGIAGVAGNGQRELAEIIMQVYPPSSGKIYLDGRDITGMEANRLLSLGVSYIPEDRLHDGFLPKASVAHNLILGWHHQEPYSKRGFIDWAKVSREAVELIDRYNIVTNGPSEVGANLSGGNIQRVIIARGMGHLSTLLVAHNPTRGLDIPSMDAFYSLLLAKKEVRVGILLISENLDELILMCDRIAALYRGEIMGVIERSRFEKYEIGRMMSGVRTDT